jgi:cytochrome c biogenesis protein CcmG/thiol:disulfide interchange protein DsbE
VNWRRSLIGVAAAVPVIALLGFGLTRNPREIASPLPGRAAPEFALPVFAVGDAMDAAATPDTVRLSELTGQVVVLNFWASWCLACRDEHEPLSRVAASYASTADVKFFGVLYNDMPRNGLAWIRQMGGQSYSSLQDPGSRTAIDYGLYGVPETFFIGRDGRVAYKHIGPVTESVLREKVEQLRAGAATGSAGSPGSPG